MKIFADLLAALASLAGLVCVGLAIYIPRRYDLSSASAIQVTQVYSEAQYYLLIAIAAFLFAVVLEVARNGD